MPPNRMMQVVFVRNCREERLGWRLDRCGRGHSIGSMKLAAFNNPHPRSRELNNSATGKAVSHSFVLARSSALAVWECAVRAQPASESPMERAM